MVSANERKRPSRRRKSGLRCELLRQRYLMKDDAGNLLETPWQMLVRVAKAVAAPEERYGASPSEISAITMRFLHMMRRCIFLPNSPTLMNAGRPNAMLSACFVLGMDDSIDGIVNAMRQAVLVQAAGGGTGFAFDSLRPSGDPSDLRVMSEIETFSQLVRFS